MGQFFRRGTEKRQRRQGALRCAADRPLEGHRVRGPPADLRRWNRRKLLRHRRHRALRQNQDRHEPLHRQPRRGRPMLSGWTSFRGGHVDSGALGVRRRRVPPLLRVDVHQLVRVGLHPDGDGRRPLPCRLLAGGVAALPDAGHRACGLRLRVDRFDARHVADNAVRDDGVAPWLWRPRNVHDPVATRRSDLSREGVHLVRLPSLNIELGKINY